MPNKLVDESKKLVRPRFASTELGIREKLFVAVLTSSPGFNSYALAVNKTGAHHVTKMMFFSSAKPNNPSPGMPYVSFPDKDSKNLPIHTLKYIAEHYSNAYDYYMFITDRTYIRAEKIYELVSHISISEEVHMGVPDTTDSGICTLEGGVILSQSVIRQVISDLEWCLINAKTRHSDTLGQCVYHASLLPCNAISGDKVFHHYRLNDFDYDDDIEILRRDPKFNSSVSVYPMPDDLSHYKIHRYFCKLELNLTRQEIDKAKESIINLSQYTAEGKDSLIWPVGSQEEARPKTRFDIIRWDYFTDTDIYFDDDFTNVRLLKGVHKLDITEITQTAFWKANYLYNDMYVSYKLVNGYRRFEPSRGMEYIIDVELKDKEGLATVKRFHMLRPLGKVEIVPMPYVTETTKINLILPVFANEIEDFGKFFHEFDISVLQTGDDTLLYVLFISVGKSPIDEFPSAKATMEYYVKLKKGNGAKMAMKTWQTDSKPREIEIIDHIMQDFKSDSLIAVIRPSIQMETAFLNRVRLNTIMNNQVFFPITFWQYKTNLAYDEGDVPSMVELNGKYGHFDIFSYEHFSFYAGDYQSARKIIPVQEVKKLQVFDLFLRNRRLHIFRAAEPSLRVRWQNITCNVNDVASSDLLEICSERSYESLASRPQLAKLVFKYQENTQNLLDTKNHGHQVHQSKLNKIKDVEDDDDAEDSIF
ncbi:hypothetical protein FSP39_021723 [Pinctada imbricata]|uniref:Hexosyltransferase n=1 Tax=Pinctada imbricata TaxID=66713 RepID=A0AA88YUH6_PINIB|nr:hypothetical protein FSP39_021723 [Pinctada imbricata]